MSEAFIPLPVSSDTAHPPEKNHEISIVAGFYDRVHFHVARSGEIDDVDGNIEDLLDTLLCFDVLWPLIYTISNAHSTTREEMINELVDVRIGAKPFPDSRHASEDYAVLE